MLHNSDTPPPHEGADNDAARTRRRGPSGRRPPTRRLIITAAVLISALTAIFLLYRYNPLSTPFFPRCPSKLLTGYDCPGCGSLRAAHAMLHGDIAAAWRFNAAIFLIYLPATAIIILSRLPLPDRFSTPLRRITSSPLFPAVILAAIVIWTVFRNL